MKKRQIISIFLVTALVLASFSFAFADSQHVVSQGDTLAKIAKKYGTTYQELASYNGIKNPHYITVGQVIKIPQKAGSTTKPVDTATAVAPVVPVTPAKPVATDATAADTVLYGTIYTADSKDSIVEAAAVKDGKFICVGTKAEVAAFVGKNTEVVELGEGMAMPGFVEAHAHGVEGGVGMLFEVNLMEADSMEGYLAIIKDFMKENQDIKFLTGIGWINGFVPEGGPTAKALDAVVSDIPVAIYSGDHHSVWVNSKAMELSGVNASTKDVAGGVIERDAAGNPTGTFRENAQGLVTGVIPDYSVEEYKAGIMAYQEEVISYGITTYFEPMVRSDNMYNAFVELEKSGELLLNVFAGLEVDPGEGMKAQVEKAAKLMKESKGGKFQVVAVKLFADGVIEGHTAYLLENYADSDDRGESMWPDQASFNEACAIAAKAGLQLHTHAIGDAAVSMTLDGYEYAAAQNGGKLNRPAITHVQLVASKDFKRMADLGVIAAANSYWCCKEPGYFAEVEVPFLGETRANTEYPIKSFFDNGVMVTVASDFPVTWPSMPLEAIQAGVTRTIAHGDNIGDPATTLGEGQKVTLMQMLKAATYNGAYENYAESYLGSIEKGKQADYIILEKNLMKMDPFEIVKTNILKTVIEGKTM